jgi:acyl-coenzyme A thioesterase 9
VLLPFSKDESLRADYITYVGTIRVGRILEDLVGCHGRLIGVTPFPTLSRSLPKDALAGTIAYKHCDDGNPSTRPLTIVTASVDRIDLLDKLDSHQCVQTFFLFFFSPFSFFFCFLLQPYN